MNNESIYNRKSLYHPKRASIFRKKSAYHLEFFDPDIGVVYYGRKKIVIGGTEYVDFLIKERDGIMYELGESILKRYESGRTNGEGPPEPVKMLSLFFKKHPEMR